MAVRTDTKRDFGRMRRGALAPQTGGQPAVDVGSATHRLSSRLLESDTPGAIPSPSGCMSALMDTMSRRDLRSGCGVIRS